MKIKPQQIFHERLRKFSSPPEPLEWVGKETSKPRRPRKLAEFDRRLPSRKGQSVNTWTNPLKSEGKFKNNHSNQKMPGEKAKPEGEDRYLRQQFARCERTPHSECQEMQEFEYQENCSISVGIFKNAQPGYGDSSI